MSPEDSQDTKFQPVEKSTSKTAKKSKKERRDLSPLEVQILVERFVRARVPRKALAEEMGLSIGTVMEALIEAALAPKPPQPERGASMPVLIRKRAA